MDIKSFLEDEGIEYTEGGSKNVSHGWVGIQCPFCFDNSNHCGVRLKDAHFSCWICGEYGKADKLAAKIKGISFKQAKIVLEEYGFEDAEEEIKVRKRIVKELKIPEDTKDIDIFHIPKLIKKWLKKRHFRIDIINIYSLRWLGVASSHPLRLFIPLHDEHKNLVSYILADVTGKAKIKYLICPDEIAVEKKKEIIYGLNLVPKDAKRLYIVEGVTDKWRIGKDAVAIIGKELYTEQAKKIVKFAIKRKIEEICVLLDIGTKKEKNKAVSLLLTFTPPTIQVFTIIIETGDHAGDPAEFTKKQVQTLKNM